MGIGDCMHRVTEGDVLSYLAAMYGVDVYDIARMNDLDLDNPVISKGQILFIQKVA